jgi:hypothetical protein
MKSVSRVTRFSRLFHSFSVIMVLALVIMGIAPVLAVETPYQPGPESVQDTWISSAYQGQNYSGDDYLAVGQTVSPGLWAQGLIQFDVSSLPSNVTDARLRLAYQGTTSGGCVISAVAVYRITAP